MINNNPKELKRGTQLLGPKTGSVSCGEKGDQPSPEYGSNTIMNKIQSIDCSQNETESLLHTLAVKLMPISADSMPYGEECSSGKVEETPTEVVKNLIDIRVRQDGINAALAMMIERLRIS